MTLQELLAVKILTLPVAVMYVLVTWGCAELIRLRLRIHIPALGAWRLQLLASLTVSLWVAIIISSGWANLSEGSINRVISQAQGIEVNISQESQDDLVSAVLERLPSILESQASDTQDVDTTNSQGCELPNKETVEPDDDGNAELH